MKMPFGKYQDRELTEVPRQYLCWLRGQQWLGGWLVKEIDAVLNGEIVAPSDESFEEALKAWETENDRHHDEEKNRNENSQGHCSGTNGGR